MNEEVGQCQLYCASSGMRNAHLVLKETGSSSRAIFTLFIDMQIDRYEGGHIQ